MDQKSNNSKNFGKTRSCLCLVFVGPVPGCRFSSQSFRIGVSLSWVSKPSHRGSVCCIGCTFGRLLCTLLGGCYTYPRVVRGSCSCGWMLCCCCSCLCRFPYPYLAVLMVIYPEISMTGSSRPMNGIALPV